MKKVIPGLTLIVLSMNMNTDAQQTGTVNICGFTFTIPEGWVGQPQEDSYLIQSELQPGIILMTENPPKSMHLLKEEIYGGLTDNHSYTFQLTGDLNEIEENMIGGEFKGMLQNNEVKGFLVGLLNN